MIGLLCSIGVGCVMVGPFLLPIGWLNKRDRKKKDCLGTGTPNSYPGEHLRRKEMF